MAAAHEARARPPAPRPPRLLLRRARARGRRVRRRHHRAHGVRLPHRRGHGPAPRGPRAHRRHRARRGRRAAPGARHRLRHPGAPRRRLDGERGDRARAGRHDHRDRGHVAPAADPERRQGAGLRRQGVLAGGLPLDEDPRVEVPQRLRPLGARRVCRRGRARPLRHEHHRRAQQLRPHGPGLRDAQVPGAHDACTGRRRHHDHRHVRQDRRHERRGLRRPPEGDPRRHLLLVRRQQGGGGVGHQARAPRTAGTPRTASPRGAAAATASRPR